MGALDSHCIRARGEGLDLETWRELLILLVGQAAAVRHTALGTPAGLDEVTDLAEYLSHEAEGEISVECATRTIAVEIAKAIRNRKPVRSLGFIAIPLAVAVKYGSFELFDSALEEIKTARGRAAEAQRVAKEATERREQQELAAQLRADRQRTLDADAARALHPSLAEDARGFAKLLANVSRATGRPRPEIIDAAVRIVADMQRGRPRVIHRYRSWRALEPQLKAEFDALAAAAG